MKRAKAQPTSTEHNPPANYQRQRVVIENVKPAIDGGQFAIKRVSGEKVIVEADIFTDGHDALTARLLFRGPHDAEWSETPMELINNDRWRGQFTVSEIGIARYTVQGWVDSFKTWRRDFEKRVAANQNVAVDLLIGANLVEAAAARATDADAKRLTTWVAELRGKTDIAKRTEIALSAELNAAMHAHQDQRFATTYDRELSVQVDPVRALFGAWYEMFPRSASPEPGRHGTFKDVEARLPYVAGMGFDVLYLPPIHPVGRAFRKGKNNSLTPTPDDVGSPWAIGSAEGGHKAIHPQLGTLKDFRHLVTAAKKFGIDITLDIAFQCSPDHPYVKEHPQWFRARPDGTIQYAENPPKKYQDIYPFDFETEDWHAMWHELKSIFDFWIAQGVRIFRVDNPHTKAFAFWEWCLAAIKREHPDTIFLAEAFTRPKLLYRLAKVGYEQSYNYFPWRNTKWELTQFFTELEQTGAREFFRPNLWPNTPDILTEYHQFGARPAFMARFTLAATLGASYGIYGPPFEHCENKPREPRSEEYLDSEKYQLRHWDLDKPGSLKTFIATVNRIRRENAPLQQDRNLRFHPVDNDELIAYSKFSDDFSQIILVVVNLDPHHKRSGWIDLPIDEFGLVGDKPYQAHDLLTDARYLWHGPRNYVELDPHVCPTHIFRLRRRIRTERDFDYYL